MSVPWVMHASASCPNVIGWGYRCMISYCPQEATGHVDVEGGPHNGRCFAVLCAHHASEEGVPAVKEQMVQWIICGLLTVLGGPGPNGAPEVWHRDHLDPLPTHTHTEETR